MTALSPEPTGPSMVDQDEWDVHLRYWELFYAVCFLVMAALLWFGGETDPVRRIVASAAMAGMLGWYLLFRSTFDHDPPRPGIGWLYRIGLLTLFAVTVTSADITAYLLFPIASQLFTVPPVRHTVVAVVVGNFAPVLPAVLWGDRAEVLRGIGIAVVTATASVVIGTLVYRIIFQSAERGGLIAELRASRDEVARLSRQAGVDAERRRLAAEIHDTVTQGLASIVLLTQAARATDAGRDEQLELIEQTARDSLAEARGLVSAVDDVAVEPRVVDEAVAELTASAGARLVRDDEPEPLPPNNSIVLLRAVGEALTNAGKHAPGAAVEVRLSYPAGAARAVVVDTGPGFDPAAVSAGYGLAGMRNRVGGVGGRCTVDSRPGVGTTVTVEVPR